jgi:hypothetical protein
MNWKRGLFRLWLLAAICWAVPVGILVWDQLGAHRPLTEMVDEQEAFKVKEARAVGYSDTEIASYLNLYIPPDWHGRVSAVIAIVGPPVAMFLLGYALLWIGRGFRSRA